MIMVIEDFFRHLWWEGPSYSPVVSLDNNAFPAFIEVDLRGDEIEVPFFLIRHVIRAKSQGYDKLAFNLVNGCDPEGRRTFHHKTISTILGKFASATRSPMRIAHVVTSKGIHYYGNQGIILDHEYDPLFVATVRMKLAADGGLRLSHPMCKLSYKVFENSQEIVEKTIIKQAIPFFATRQVEIELSPFCSQESVELAITSLDSMVVVPNRPTIASSAPDAINQTILINNLNCDTC